jgi:hypothetical protein
MTSLKRGLSAFEAIINGMFGIFLCVMIALMPLVSLEFNFGLFPAGNETVVIQLVLSVGLEGLNIYRILTAYLDPESPPGPSAALRYQPPSKPVFRLLSFLWYLFHMLSAAAVIVMCKFQALHGATTAEKISGLIFGFGMLGAFNVFLALTARVVFDSPSFVDRLWKCRFMIDIAFEVTALAIVCAT